MLEAAQPDQPGQTAQTLHPDTQAVTWQQEASEGDSSQSSAFCGRAVRAVLSVVEQ